MAVQALDTRASAPPREPVGHAAALSAIHHLAGDTGGAAPGWWLATDVLGTPAYVVPPPEDVLRALAAA